MPTIIDALVITLGMDTSGLKAGRQETSRNLTDLKSEIRSIEDQIVAIRFNSTEATKKLDQDQIKSLQFVLHQRKRAAQDEEEANKKNLEAQKKQKDAYDDVKRSVLGVAAVVIGVGGLERYVSSTVTGFSAMGRAARAAGVDVAELAAFGNMIGRNGGDPNSAKASFSTLAASMERFRTLGQASPELIGALQQIGGGPADSPMAIFEKFAKYAEGKDPRLVSQTGTMLGFDEASINEAMKGQGRVRADMAESYKLGVPKQDDIDKVTALQKEFLKVQQAILGNANTMLIDAAPALTGLLHLVDEGIEKFPAFTKAVLALGVALITLGSLKGLGAVGGLLTGGGGGAAAAGAGGAAGGEAVATAGGAGLLARFGLPGLTTAAVLSLHGDSAPYDPKYQSWSMDQLTDARKAYISRWGFYPKDGGVRKEIQGIQAEINRRNAPHAAPSPAKSGGGAGGGDRLAQIRDALAKSLGITQDQAAGIESGLYAESHLRGINETHPLIPGSRGGFGWGQWTGPRRRQFEAWAAAHHLDPKSDAANMGFLLADLTGNFGGVLSSVKHAGSARAAAAAFFPYLSGGAPELQGLLPGHVAYAQRLAGLKPGSRDGEGGLTIQGDVIVQTQATDARGIANDLKAELERQYIAAQANGGLS